MNEYAASVVNIFQRFVFEQQYGRVMIFLYRECVMCAVVLKSVRFHFVHNLGRRGIAEPFSCSTVKTFVLQYVTYCIFVAIVKQTNDGEL